MNVRCVFQHTIRSQLIVRSSSTVEGSYMAYVCFICIHKHHAHQRFVIKRRTINVSFVLFAIYGSLAILFPLCSHFGFRAPISISVIHRTYNMNTKASYTRNERNSKSKTNNMRSVIALKCSNRSIERKKNPEWCMK